MCQVSQRVRRVCVNGSIIYKIKGKSEEVKEEMKEFGEEVEGFAKECAENWNVLLAGIFIGSCLSVMTLFGVYKAFAN